MASAKAKEEKTTKGKMMAAARGLGAGSRTQLPVLPPGYERVERTSTQVDRPALSSRQMLGQIVGDGGRGSAPRAE